MIQAQIIITYFNDRPTVRTRQMFTDRILHNCARPKWLLLSTERKTGSDQGSVPWGPSVQPRLEISFSTFEMQSWTLDRERLLSG